jgi:hypothetical protein
VIKNFIYSKNESVLRKLLQNFEDKPEIFEVNKDPTDSSRGFIDNIYLELANHPSFANNPAIQHLLGKYVIIVRYDKFK